ncbi:hypothetical protein HF086_003216 [Spodoptera exigua]|uniref:Secreted protein n=1 Tax=Spodoptera exigua TaxID=7107 RepID=A0A922SEM3_SPOEX|nr:hypothetical protein HF086_003216 [Spodoptera exigua]
MLPDAYIVAAVLFTLLEVVHWSSETGSNKQAGIKRESKSPTKEPRVCVGNTWKTVGKYRFWQRVACVQRRYGKICARDENYKLQTFESFCAMKSSDCSGKNGWTPLHKGECYRTLITHYTYDARGRAEKAILEVSKRHRNLEPYVGVA